MVEPTPYPLGRVVQHDPKSLAFPAQVAGIALTTIRHARHVGPFDQGNLGSCTGNAGVGALATDPLFSTLPGAVAQALNEALAISVYSQATTLDSEPGSYPPDDTGSSGLAVAKALKQRGYISGYTHAFSLDATLQSLVTGPVIIGINWYNNFFTPDGSGLLTTHPGDSVAGGHEVVLDEINVEHRLVGGTNSWGPGWGREGRFYMSFDLLGRLLSEQGDATVFVPINAPAPFPVPVPVPTPAPVPVPDPAPVTPVDVDAADQALWDAVKVWAGLRHVMTSGKVAAALNTWAKGKGLE